MVATKDAMAAAGALGATMGSNLDGGFGGGWGGAAGGRFGARLTKPRSAAARIEVPHDAEAVREQVRASLAQSGAVVEDPNAAGDGSLWGLVGSGVWNMAPALVRIDVDTTAGGGTRVHVRATGREGLIKQGIASKAVDRLCEAIARQPST